MKTKHHLTRLVLASVLLATGLILPMITGQIQAIGKIISPMHIPVLIGGLTLGPIWGLAVGFITPILRGLLFGMPPIPHAAFPMAFELGAYGLFGGLFYPPVRRKLPNLGAIVFALLLAMIAGRLVGGAAKALLLALGVIGTQTPFTLAAFWASYFVGTLPGALIHLVLVPAVVAALERAKLSPLASKL